MSQLQAHKFRPGVLYSLGWCFPFCPPHRSSMDGPQVWGPVLEFITIHWDEKWGLGALTTTIFLTSIWSVTFPIRILAAKRQLENKWKPISTRKDHLRGTYSLSWLSFLRTHWLRTVSGNGCRDEKGCVEIRGCIGRGSWVTSSRISSLLSLKPLKD